METNTPDYVSYKVYEAAQARSDRRFKWMMILVAFLIVALLGTNTGWLIYESSMEDIVTTTQTVSQDSGDGGTNTFTGDFYGGDYMYGGDYNGETDSK